MERIDRQSVYIKLQPISHVFACIELAWTIFLSVFKLFEDLCFLKKADLGLKDIEAYDVYAAGCSEVSIDVLTGELEINRTDLVKSKNILL